MLNVEKSKFFPEIVLGYVNQKITPSTGLDSWMVGISFPILFFPQMSRCKQAKMDLKMAEWEEVQNQAMLSNKVIELQSQLSQQQKTLDYYVNAALKEARSLTEGALLQFQESAIGIVEFVQSLETARNIYQNYIETVYSYISIRTRVIYQIKLHTEMKAIFYLAISLYMVACSQPKQETSEATPSPVSTHIETETKPDSTTTDAVSGATNVANATTFNGIFIVAPQQQATVSALMGGIEESTSLLVGKSVKKGDVIDVLDNPEFINLQQSYLDATAQLEFLEKEYQRQQNLVAQDAASEKQFQQSKADFLSVKSKSEALAAQLSLLGVDVNDLQTNGMITRMEIQAPLSGSITTTNVNIGKYLNPGDPICDIIDNSHLLIQLTAYEKDIRSLHVGNRLEFRVNGMGEENFEAEIININQKVDNENRSIKVFARPLETRSDFCAGMYVNAKIKNN